LAAAEPAKRRTDFDRTLSCTVRDLGVVFTGRLRDGALQDISRSEVRDAQIKLTQSGGTP